MTEPSEKKVSDHSAANFGVALSKLGAREQHSLTREFQRLRVNFYHRFLEANFLDDSEESLLRFYEQVEKPCLLSESAIIESCTAHNFNNNATKQIEKTFKKSAKNSADVELNIALYDAFKFYMVGVEEFRNVLAQVTLYMEDVSLALLKQLEGKTDERLSYSYGAANIFYLLFLKGLKRSISSLLRLTHSNASKEFIQMLFFIVVSMLIGTDQAKNAPPLHRMMAIGIVPLGAFVDVLCPLNMDQKVVKWLEGKEANVHVRLMQNELKRMGQFFRGGANKLREILNDYARICNFHREVTQTALDKKIIMIRTLEALLKGEDFDTETLEDFIHSSEIQLTDLGRGWQLLEEADEDEEPVAPKSV